MSVRIEYLKDHMRKNKKVKFLTMSKKVLETGIVLVNYTVSGGNSGLNNYNYVMVCIG